MRRLSIKPSKSKVVFQTPWFEVEEQHFPQHAELEGKPHYRVNCSDGVFVFAMTPKKEVILVHQFRPALRQYTFECPAGGVTGKESPRKTARRELMEETGFKPGKLVKIGTGHAMLDRLSCTMHGFLALDCVPIPNFESEETIQVILAPWPKFQRMVKSGKFKQLAGLGFLYQNFFSLEPALLDQSMKSSRKR
jgi:ADP-ribose pyrophosphatase